MGARVGLFVHLEQVVSVEMRINLGCRDTGVAEQLLDLSDVAARLEHVGGAGMPEHMRMHVSGNALAPGSIVDAYLNSPWTKAAPTATNEHSLLTVLGYLGPDPQPALQGLDGE